MPYFPLDKPSNDFEILINSSFWKYYQDITSNYSEVIENDLPQEMSNNFRRYGALNQFNNNYHYYKVTLGTPTSPREESHRYRTQIIAALLEREFDLDFEIHHTSYIKDSYGKYDDTKVIIIYDSTKLGVKNIHQKFHTKKINDSKRIRGEIK